VRKRRRSTEEYDFKKSLKRDSGKLPHHIERHCAKRPPICREAVSEKGRSEENEKKIREEK
jgi:hypothetical protein